MEKEKKQVAGLKNLLSRGLGLKRRDELVVVSHEGYELEFGLFDRAAASLGIKAIHISYSRREQKRFKPTGTLPRTIRGLLEFPEGIVIITDYEGALTPFRMSVLDKVNENNKIATTASMPGVRAEQFEYLCAKYDKLRNRCIRLCHRLVPASKLTILTHEKDGTEHTLSALIRHFKPVPSSGLVNQGDWQNAPSGETFILPERRSASGSIVINGSVPGRVLAENNEEVVLVIRRGIVREVLPEAGDAQACVVSLLFRDYEKLRPIKRNATSLCEIGIGVNDMIGRLHGLPIFDEKKYGTSHVAFGSNNQLGGDISGSTHHDFISLDAEVTTNLDEEPLLRNSQLIIDDQLVFPSWRKFSHKRDQHAVVEWLPVLTTIERGELHLKWHPSRRGVEKPELTPVGDSETARLAAIIWKRYSSKRPYCEIERLRELDANVARLYGTLRVMERFGIVKIRPSQ